MNFPPPQGPSRRQPRQQQNPFAPVAVIMALVNQSKNRYAAISDMIQKQDQGFRQLDLESTTLAQVMTEQMPQQGATKEQVDERLHALAMSVQAAKRAGMITRTHLEQQLECEKFLHSELMRWLRGQEPVKMAVSAQPVQQGQAPAPSAAPAPQMPAWQAPAQLAAGAPGAQTTQIPQPPPQQLQPAPNPYLPQGLQPQQQPFMQQQQQQPQPMSHGVPGHMFGPFPGQANTPYQPASPESLPVTQLPVTQALSDPMQPAMMMPPPVQAQQYASMEAARAAIPGPPPPIVSTPPVVQYASPEQAKSVIDASHANNVPVASVQPSANGQAKPVAS